jgi:caa(3)-type oxidase subunit IV
MHSDSAAVKKSVRTYMLVGAALLVFTAITVGANQFHFGVPVAVTVALIIATM